MFSCLFINKDFRKICTKCITVLTGYFAIIVVKDGLSDRLDYCVLIFLCFFFVLHMIFVSFSCQLSVTV